MKESLKPFSRQGETLFQYLEIPALSRCPGVRHGFSVRGPEGSVVTGDRAGILFLKQVHGREVVTVERTGPGLHPPGIERDRGIEGDGMITGSAGVLLGVRVADCLPAVFFAPGKGIVGVAHAGWRSTRLRIVQHLVEIGEEGFNAKPEDFWIGLGPSIGPCCYPVGEEVRDLYAAEFPDSEKFFSRAPDGSLRLDLRKANISQLRAAGVPGEQILELALCTSCRNDLFHSARRNGRGSGRQVAFVGLEAVAKAEVL